MVIFRSENSLLIRLVLELFILSIFLVVSFEIIERGGGKFLVFYFKVVMVRIES